MTKHVVRTDFERPDPGVVARLRAAGVATIHEAQGRTGLLPPQITPIQSGVQIAGPAVTVVTNPDDNMMIHAAVETVQPGDVLLVTVTAPSHHGMFGDLLAGSLQHRGCAGLVIDAGVRDTADLRHMGFPVWSRWVHSQGTVKATPGSVNVAVRCGDTEIVAGDVVVADDDGVVIIPRGETLTVAEASEERIQKEAATRARLDAGELGLDMYGLRDKLTSLGVEWITPDQTE